MVPKTWAPCPLAKTSIVVEDLSLSEQIIICTARLQPLSDQASLCTSCLKIYCFVCSHRVWTSHRYHPVLTFDAGKYFTLVFSRDGSDLVERILLDYGTGDTQSGQFYSDGEPQSSGLERAGP